MQDEKRKSMQINEDELEGVSGGSGGGDGEKCYFHPKSSDSWGEKHGADSSYIWKQCSYGALVGIGCKGCACNGRDHCVDRHHKLDATTGELLPAHFANHKSKLKSNSYNT